MFMSIKASKKTIAVLTREFIEKHPSILDCLQDGLINYSALARKMSNELQIGQEEAILIAARRYAKKLENQRKHETDILEILHASRIEMHSRIAFITARNDWRILQSLDSAIKTALNQNISVQVIHGSQGISIVAEDNQVDDLIQTIGKDNLIKVRTGLVKIVIRSPENIEEVSGVVAYLCQALARHRINCLEIVICYTDNIFIIDEKDMIEAYEALNTCIAPM